jgi:hypothetical protein
MAQLSYAEQLRADVEQKNAAKLAAKKAAWDAERADEQRIQRERDVLAREKDAERQEQLDRHRRVEQRDAHAAAQHQARTAAVPDRDEQIRRLQEQVAPDEPWQKPARVGSKPVRSDDYYNQEVVGSTANYFESRIAEGKGTHAARLEAARQERWQREHGQGGPIKSAEDMARERARAMEERDRRNQEEFENRRPNFRDEQIRKMQDTDRGVQRDEAPQRAMRGGGGTKEEREWAIAERDRRNLAAYEERQNNTGPSRDAQIAALQEKMAPDVAPTPSARTAGRRMQQSGVGNALSGGMGGLGGGADYYNEAPSGSTSDYFSNRLNEEANPHQAKLRELRERRYADEANGIVRETQEQQKPWEANKAGLGRMPGGGSSINLSWN